MEAYDESTAVADKLGSLVNSIRAEASRIGAEGLRALALRVRDQDAPPLEQRGSRPSFASIQNRLNSDAVEPRLDPACDMAWAIAIGCYQMAAETTGDESAFYTGQGSHYLAIALDCEDGGSPTG
ncbi:hypothetical protein GCM10009610_23380 [Pseudonocardia xinjiangensis]